MSGVTFAAGVSGGGTGGGGGTGSGSGGGTDPVTFDGAYLTTIAENASTTGKEVNGNLNVDPSPKVELVFNKNVVNDSVWDKLNIADNEKKWRAILRALRSLRKDILLGNFVILSSCFFP